jgi:predicted RNase H-like HicB family nuclease
MNSRYSVVMYWSTEDEAFVAYALELPGCVADGSTKDEAIKNLEIVISEWIETAKELGREVPEPMDAVQHERSFQEFQESIRLYVKREVETAVSRVLQDIAKSQNELTFFRGGAMFAGMVGSDPAERWKLGGGQ